MQNAHLIAWEHPMQPTPDVPVVGIKKVLLLAFQDLVKVARSRVKEGLWFHNIMWWAQVWADVGSSAPWNCLSRYWNRSDWVLMPARWTTSIADSSSFLAKDITFTLNHCVSFDFGSIGGKQYGVSITIFVLIDGAKKRLYWWQAFRVSTGLNAAEDGSYYHHFRGHLALNIAVLWCCISWHKHHLLTVSWTQFWTVTPIHSQQNNGMKKADSKNMK
jgi:hypothetical protein